MNEQKLFGMRMRELRKARKLSQEQLAVKTGISSKYVSRIETGHHFPSMDILTKLTGALNVEMEDLFKFAHEAKNARELRKSLKELLNRADLETLRLAVKVLRAIVR
ncbi:MAG: helix-turn-helix domain-containing protein [Nitrospinota bacterium]